MVTQSLNEKWNIRPCDGEEWTIATDVPCSVLHAMVREKLAPDPFYRRNEYEARELFTRDYSYSMTFVPEEEILKQKCIELVFYGLDTLAEIRLNGEQIGEADNMHRIWRFSVKDKLRKDENHLEICFRSSLNFIREKGKDPSIHYTPKNGISGESYIRKGHWMFGWDWGPQLPDAGIWRPVELCAYSEARISDVLIHQVHRDGAVELEMDVKAEVLDWLKAETKPDETENTDLSVKERYGIKFTLTAPDQGGCLTSYGELRPGRTVQLSALGKPDIITAEGKVTLKVVDPELWWPNTYGKQPLYEVKAELCSGDGGTIDVWQKQIGLRELTVSREQDQWGEEFCFQINGIKIFAMGADYVPEDSIITRVTPERTRRLLEDCAAANFNSVRVWGGGYYPDDYFFDICDELGLIVWQDAMFACNVYRMTHEFEQNIRAELKENFTRIRHHASLGLICGNNEMEFGWVDWPNVITHHPSLKADYIKQFEYVLPEMAETCAPDVFFWPSSPSSGGCFDDPNSENRGDVHYWDVWHKMKPFTDYEKFYFRFCSEFGFESFPGEKTVRTYTEERDRNIFSPVMESHQKNGAANGLIMYYISSYYRYPKDFGSLLYISQILQAEAMRHGVEHWRRNRGRCMGAIYWQLNDCWPVASWASIDYYGRWKALHYYAKRFFAPVMVTAKYTGDELRLWVHNDSREALSAVLEIEIRDMELHLLRQFEITVNVAPLSVYQTEHICLGEILKEKQRSSHFAAARLRNAEGNVLAEKTTLFVLPKQADFPAPEYQIEVSEEEEEFAVHITSDCFAYQVELVSEITDVPFSDNYFDLCDADGVTVTLPKSRLEPGLTAEELKQSISIRSVADSY